MSSRQGYCNVTAKRIWLVDWMKSSQGLTILGCALTGYNRGSLLLRSPSLSLPWLLSSTIAYSLCSKVKTKTTLSCPPLYKGSPLSFFLFLALSEFEKHSSLNRQLATRVIKTFVAQFLNTGVLILLVNVRIDRIFFWQGKFTDITPLWYENVGATLLSTMIINVFTVPSIKASLVIFQKLHRCWDRGMTYIHTSSD